LRVGSTVEVGEETPNNHGDTATLKNIPEGTLIYNIEQNPGDGGKFVRSSGTFARVATKLQDTVVVLLPSKKQKTFRADCRATIGIVSGGGRPDKPFVKAGNKYFKMKAKNKLYPSISGTSQNAVDHPFGGSSSGHKGKPTVTSRNAPPGRKVGKISPKRTGKKR